MKKIAVLASGRGSNFQAILDSLAAGKINGECVALLTDNKDSYSIERAKTTRTRHPLRQTFLSL